MLVGIIEEVGTRGRKAFTNLDELWDVFSTAWNNPKNLKKGEISERRNEARTKKELPFVFFHNDLNLVASTVNYSRSGLGIRILEKVVLPVGDTVALKARDSIATAQVMWVRKEIDPFITTAGLKIVEGAVKLKGAGKNISLTTGGTCDQSVTDL